MQAQTTDDIGIGSEAAVNWKSYYGEVFGHWLQKEQCIGGQDTIVQIMNQVWAIEIQQRMRRHWYLGAAWNRNADRERNSW